MSSDIAVMKRKKERLEAAAGEDFNTYLAKINQYFSGKISKVELETEVAKFLSSEALHHHNELMTLINDYGFCSSPSYSMSDFYLANTRVSKTGSKDKSPLKKAKIGHYKLPAPDGNFLRPVSVSSYLPVAVPPKLGSEVQTTSHADKSALFGLMLSIAWEKDKKIDSVEKQAVELVAHAVRFQLKHLLMSVLSRRNSCKIREGGFKYAMGSPAVNVYLQNAQKLMRSDANSECNMQSEFEEVKGAIPNDALDESIAAAKYASSVNAIETKAPVSSWDLFETLQMYRGVIPCHSVYSRAVEEVSAALYHPSREQIKQAALRHAQVQQNDNLLL